MATSDLHFPNSSPPGKIVKWRVNSGTMISTGRILLIYKCINTENGEATEKKLRATQFGRVTKLHFKEGDIIQPGQAYLTLVGCKHPTVMKDLCAECGADLRQEAEKNDGKTGPMTEASVPMVHSIPELKVCPELAEKIGKEDEQRLLQEKKLALLVDLDQTIVHTTNDNVPVNMKDVFHYQLYGSNSPWYHTRLRPGTRHFLSEMNRLYELHICTFGARNYAHTVAALLDKEGALFSHRILSRDECFDPASKTANLKALFPCGDDMVCIIDDREDVWQGCGNLVQVKPYHFFRHTGDIHAPPGLDKKETPEILETTVEPIVDEPESEMNIEKETVLNTDKNGTTSDKAKENDSDKKISENEEMIETEKITINEDVKENEEITTDEEVSNNKEIPKDEEISKDEDLIRNEEISKDHDITEDAIITETEEKPITKPDVKGEINTSVDERQNDDVAKNLINDNEKEEEEVCVQKEVKEKPTAETNNSLKEGEKVNDEDQDDYLLYLEDILRRIHAEFYENINQGKGRKPLREIIPRVRARVLKGLCLTFSGLIPTHQKLHESRAYKVAKAFGAEVTQDLTDKTTHLVAIKPGTAKANMAKKSKNIKIVNPDWLWLSAERWERVDERLFPLTTKARASRIPPPHCSSPERVEEEQSEIIDSFADTINPLMSFSAEEIENMDKEVEEDMSDQEMDYTGLETDDLGTKRIYEENSDSDGSNDDTNPKVKRRKISIESSSGDSSDDNNKNIYERYHKNEDGDIDEDDDPVTRFRRGEGLPDDLDLGDNSQDSIGDPPDDDPDDREWNALGAALEREFLTE